jgi:TRAP-type C4-dicarboxylate transport system substrate-binding protein|tara:strand:- start:285 stop:1394 length:1110 start_codon:yes stop_codon:yes gene_type:complete
MISKMQTMLMAIALLVLSSGMGVAKELSYGIMVTSTNPLVTYGFQPFADAVRKASNDDINFTLHTGGSLVGAKTSLSGVRQGLVDAALVAPSYVPSELPKYNIFADLTPLGEDPYVMMAAATETVFFDCDECLDEFKQNRIVPFGVMAATPYYLMCKETASTLDELQGRKVMASNPSFSGWLNEIGMVAISLPGTEIYDALERGQVDCIFSVLGWMDSYSLSGLVKVVFDLPMGLSASSQPLVMNQRSWDRLSENEKSIIYAEASGLIVNTTRSYVESGKRAWKNAEEKGVKWVETPEVFVSVYEKYRDSAIQKSVDAAVKNGLTDAQAVADALKRNVAKWTEILAPLEGDPEKIRQAVTEGIYARLPK